MHWQSACTRACHADHVEARMMSVFPWTGTAIEACSYSITSIALGSKDQQLAQVYSVWVETPESAIMQIELSHIHRLHHSCGAPTNLSLDLR